jgi:hypothetical protein
MQVSEEPQRVTFAPRFLLQFSSWANEQLRAGTPAPESLGLLFGAPSPKGCIVQSFEIVATTASESVTYKDWCASFENWQAHAASDARTMWLDLLGWFCFRPQSRGDLLTSDIDFHTAYFSGPGKLAILFHSPRGEAVAAELYTSMVRSPGAPDHYNRVSVQLASGNSAAVPVVRPKMDEDAFLRAYEIAGELERAEKRAQWKEKLRSIFFLDRLGRNS